MRLPPGTSAADFSAALSQWREIVGGDWVLTSEEDLDPYKDAYSPFASEADERVASAVVAPATAEDVQKVVRVANRYKIPLYTISTGKNLTYGGSAPAYSGSVILDLKRMNRILEVSEANACALVEPGVSYFDLYRYIREKNLKLWIDCPDPGWGSLVGNALDHGAGYTGTPYRDHFDAHCGMEVVLADGDVVRTGMGAMPSAATWQQFKYGMGPLVDGLFSQSNFGIVTKMGFWLMPQPEAALAFTAYAFRHDDGPDFIDALIELKYADLITSQTQIISPILHVPGDDELNALLQVWDGGRIRGLDDYAKRKGMPFWTVPFVLYGPEAVIRATAAHITKRFSAIPGATVTEGAFHKFPLTDDQVVKVTDKARIGIPSLAFFSSRHSPTAPLFEGHIDFSPIVPMNGKTILEAMSLFQRTCQELDISPLGGMPLFYHTRTVCLIYAIPVGKDVAANKKARAAFSHLMDLGAAHGWGEYRIHPAFMDKGVRLYDFNDNALLRLHERLKDAIDRNGILSAGRYGIWPKHLRRAK
jgi:FAD/FMN-containing dehydrogenase